MSTEVYKLGEAAYDNENYEKALEYFTKIADENADAAAYIPLCYLNMASDMSIDASNHADNTEYLVRGQQLAVNMLNTAVRASLQVFRAYLDYPYVCQVAATVLAQALNLQYVLVSTGLTIAYNITNTTTTIRKTVERTTVGGEVVREEVLWEDVIGTETESFVSLTSYDMSDYHILGPDEKTKKIKASLGTVLKNTVQVAEILDCLGHGYDAHMIRASVACAMADTEGGDRSMALAADWFTIRARELAQAKITDQEIYTSWESIHAVTFESSKEITHKFAALIRSYRRNGQKPYLAKFYQDASQAPVVESCDTYMRELEMSKTMDQNTGGIGEKFEIFLTVFAQVSFMKIFPTILFASIISLFCGGLFHAFSKDAGIFGKVFGIVWFIITILLTFFRTITDADEFRTNNTFNIYMAIMMGTALVFSINFVVPLIAFIVLNVLAKKYK